MRRHTEQGKLPVGVTAGLVDHDGESELAGSFDDLVGQFAEVGGRDIREQKGDDPGTALAQAAGEQVGPVVQVVQGRLHFGAHGG